MSYLLETTDQADADLDALDAQLRAAVLRRLFEFAKHPGSGGSTPTRAPYPAGQLVQFTFTSQGESWWAGIVFHYSQDETRLIIDRVYAR